MTKTRKSIIFLLTIFAALCLGGCDMEEQKDDVKEEVVEITVIDTVKLFTKSHFYTVYGEYTEDSQVNFYPTLTDRVSISIPKNKLELTTLYYQTEIWMPLSEMPNIKLSLTKDTYTWVIKDGVISCI